MKSRMHFSTILMIAISTLFLVGSPVQAQVKFTTDRDEWLTDNAVIRFDTEAANIALADEVATPPSGNTVGLGGAAATLTFDKENTNLPWSFELSAPGSTVPLNATTGFTYNDNEGGSVFRSGALSPGDVNNQEDDDVAILVTDGPPLRGIAFEILDNTVPAGAETISVYGPVPGTGDSNLLGRFELPAGTTSTFFVGITSSIRIAQVVFDEDPNGDDVAFRDILFPIANCANPFADVVASYDPVIQNGEPLAVHRIFSRAVGAPDGSGVSLGDGGSITFEFTDNALTLSGDSAPDLRIVENGPDVEDTFVEFSEDGVVWLSAGSVGGSTSELDLDQPIFGFSPDDEFFFVRLTDDPDKDAQTGAAVGADIDGIEALSSRPVPQDADFDGACDLRDNCPNDFNPSQTDRDGDGVGDRCDNCRSVANPLQENENAAAEEAAGDAILGDACETGFFSLRGLGSPSPSFELQLACGIAADEVNVSIRLPFGVAPASAEFGGNCDAPPVPPAGITPGLGCTPNPPNLDLGPTVDAANSGVYGPGLMSPFDSDRLYLQLVGNGPDGRICDTDEVVTLGRFTSGPAATFSGRPTLGGVPGEDFVVSLDGFPLVIEDFTSGPGDPDLELLLRPADGEDEATATRWALCISDQTDQRMHQVAVGVQVPGATTADLMLEGCDTAPDGAGVRNCSGTVGSRVDESVSFIVGPEAGALAPRVDDTLYIAVEGSTPAPGATTLNPTAFQESCIGNIAVASPPGVPGERPLLVVDGLETLPYSDGMPAPWQTSTTFLTPLPLEDVAVGNGFETGDDTDQDGILDDADNCPFFANIDLDNNGDLLDLTPNTDIDGDACECGDASGSGAVFNDLGIESPSDLETIREYLVGSNTDLAVAQICSVSEGTECNTKDAVVLQRALNALQPGIEPRCDSALPD